MTSEKVFNNLSVAQLSALLLMAENDGCAHRYYCSDKPDLVYFRVSGRLDCMRKANYIAVVYDKNHNTVKIANHHTMKILLKKGFVNYTSNVPAPGRHGDNQKWLEYEANLHWEMTPVACQLLKKRTGKQVSVKWKKVNTTP